MRGHAALAPLISLGLLTSMAASPPTNPTSDYTPIQSCPGGACLAAAAPGDPGDQADAAGHESGAARVVCSFLPLPADEVAQLDQASLHPDQQGGWFYHPCQGGDGRTLRQWQGPIWVPFPDAANPVVDPAALAQEAYRLLPIPTPRLGMNPAADQRQLVHLVTWLWVDQMTWDARSATVSVPGQSVTATATPVQVDWSMGDGRTVTCRGPGRPYDPLRPTSVQRPTCAYTYERSSAGEPGGRLTVSATATWRVTWRATGLVTSSGQLPPLRRTAQLSVTVAEGQTLN